MKKCLFFLCSILSASPLFSQRIDLTVPPRDPVIFEKDFISTNANERDMALSPDGKEIYFTVSTPRSSFQTIVVMNKGSDGKWSKPKIAPFAGKFSDLEPAFSADGKKLYFASNRPLEGNQPKDFDIWMVERVNGTWGDPKNLGTTINTALNEFFPSVTKSGNLYFTAEYQYGVGNEDIYVSKWENNHFEKPMPLDTGVNSKSYEFNAFVDPDEKFIVFTSYGRKDDMGRGDLYVSTRDDKGKWMPAINMKFANSNYLDYCPYVSPDRKILFFTSERAALPVTFEKGASYEDIQATYQSALNGTGNLYWVSFERLMEVAKLK